MATLYTIGHSTRSLDELVEALQAHSIKTLVDIRSIPMSRRLPHFNREALEQSLPKMGIEYVWMKALGGRRKKIRDDSPNLALRNDSFRNYADYMLTPKFQQGIAELLELTGESSSHLSSKNYTITATDLSSNRAEITRNGLQPGASFMCAERVYFRCHRMLVSDWLVAHGHEVLHIDGTGPVRPHKLMSEARLVDGQVLYRGDVLF
jgi:uncharacterized protein (DUF488 family)